MPKDIQKVKTNTACCAGNGGSGHPKVYLDVEEGKPTVCPYCSRTFVLDTEVSA
jgi:uncharacterized Zn-finger protein